MSQNRLNLAISTRSQVVADLNNESLVEQTIAELEARRALKNIRGDRPPIPFLTNGHVASPDYCRELRLCMGLTQGRFARLLEVGSDVISRYEREDGVDLTNHAKARLETTGATYAQTGRRPEIPENDFHGGSLSIKPHRRVHVPAREAIREPAFALKELGIGFGGGIAVTLAIAAAVIALL